MASTVSDPIKEAQLQDPPFPNQQGPTKEPEAPREVSSDKATTIPEVKVASQGFQQDLVSTTMPAKGASKDKEGTITTEADNLANKTSKLQIKLKKWTFFCNIIMIFVRDFVFLRHVLIKYAFLPFQIRLSYYLFHFYFICFIILVLHSFHLDRPLFTQEKNKVYTYF